MSKICIKKGQGTVSIDAGNSSTFFSKKVSFYSYSITGVTNDPTSSQWREHYAPPGYLWIPNVGFRSLGPLKHTDWMFHDEDTGSSTLGAADITNLDMSEVVTAREMFRYTNFSTNSSDLTGWNVSNIRDFTSMFEDTNFNQDISGWTICSDKSTPITDVVASYWTPSEITIAGNSYSHFDRLHGWYEFGPESDGGWRVSSNGVYGVIFQKMFKDNASFNQDISSWDTSAVFRFDEIFEGASSFNQPLNSWNTSNAMTFLDMFEGASSFNQPIGSWDTSNVVMMYDMFKSNDSFNQDISSWDTSNVVSFHGMFESTNSFNRTIANWDTSNVTDMSSMFFNASVFNQDLSGWNVTNITSEPNLFDTGANSWTLPNSRPVWGTDGT